MASDPGRAHQVEQASLNAGLPIAPSMAPAVRVVGGGPGGYAVDRRVTGIAAIAALIGLTFAAFDELRQSFVPGREPRVTDVLLDLASVLAGGAGLLWVNRGGRDLGEDDPPVGRASLPVQRSE